MENRATKIVLAGIAAIVVTTGVSAVIGTYQNDSSSQVRNVSQQGQVVALTAPGGPTAPQPAPQPATGAGPSPSQNAKNPSNKSPQKKPSKAPANKALPSGISTATSFWDAGTASGNPMSFRTIASPYWPLGTTVKITYQGKSTIGVVDDFGPAEWAVAQHDIPAIIDLSEEMMASFTGSRVNTIHARFQVLKWGKGRSYRTSGTGYRLAFGTADT
jgi:hypothetical protein